MKKIFTLLLTIAIVFSLAACSQNGGRQENASSLSEESSDETQLESKAPTEKKTGSNILIAYFSWADNAILEEDVDAVTSPSVVPPGNVQQLAGWVQEETGGELFSIRVTDPYPSDWDTCLERANEERDNDARPELQENVEDLDQYDTVFLGYPNWWSDAPMAVYTFLEAYDFTGKTLIPF